MSRYRDDIEDERALVLAPVTRWTPEKKFLLMRAVQNGRITLPEARQTHALSAEELDDWWRLFRRSGLKGLKQRELAR